MSKLFSVKALVTQNRGGVRSYYHFDGLGSTRQLTNSQQTVTDSYSYDAWGNEIGTEPQPTANRFRFVGSLGYYTDAESGMMLLGVRYYDTGVGRLWSVDPLGDDLNWYAYVQSDPVNSTPVRFIGSLGYYSDAWNNPLNLQNSTGLQAQPQQITVADCWEQYRDCIHPHLSRFRDCTRRVWGKTYLVGDILACLAGCAIVSAWSGGLTLVPCVAGCLIGIGLWSLITFIRWELQCARPFERAVEGCKQQLRDCIEKAE